MLMSKNVNNDVSKDSPIGQIRAELKTEGTVCFPIRTDLDREITFFFFFFSESPVFKFGERNRKDEMVLTNITSFIEGFFLWMEISFSFFVLLTVV